MTYLELYNQVEKLESVEEIKVVIKKALLEELAGDRFSVKEIKKKPKETPKIVDVDKEILRKVKQLELKEKRKLTETEKKNIENQVRKEAK